MANVKISELPSLGNYSPYNVIVVNDVANNTTTKSTLLNAMVKTISVQFRPENPAITMTVDGSASDTISISHTITPLGIGKIITRSNTIFTNTSDNYVPLVLITDYYIYAYSGGLVPVKCVNVNSLKTSTGAALKAPFYLAMSINPQNQSTLTLKGTNVNTNENHTACIPPNSSWNASYLDWIGMFMSNALYTP